MRLNEIYDAYQDRMHFLAVYIREAHPDDGWRVPNNPAEGINYDEPTTDAERTEVARACQRFMDIHAPLLIDEIDNRVEEAYVSMPMRLFLVGADGKIAYSGGTGPFNFFPDEWEAAINEQLGTAAAAE